MQQKTTLNYYLSSQVPALIGEREEFGLVFCELTFGTIG
jgi:hypothetical protein